MDSQSVFIGRSTRFGDRKIGLPFAVLDTYDHEHRGRFEAEASNIQARRRGTTMGRAVSDIRGSVQDEILGIGTKSGSALISGASGSGKTALLRGLSDRLRGSGIATHTVDCAERYSLSSIRSGPEDLVLLVDNIERADAQLLSTCLDQIRGNHPVVMTFTTGPQLRHSAGLLERLDSGRHAPASTIDAVHRIELQPLPPREIEWLLHERSAHPLDSARIRNIVALAAGRPGWALDLAELAQHGYLGEGLYPTILEAPLNSIDLPALRSLAREFTGLSPEAAAGAVALSELGTIDLSGARDLIGRLAVSELLERGVLFKEPQDERFAVPVFVATAILPAATPELVEGYRSKIAHRLLAQEEILIPLSETEAALCARALNPPTVDQRQAGPSQAARARILQQAVSQFIDAGDKGAVRTLLLRATEHDCPLGALTHAQAVRLLAGSSAAAASLATAPDAPELGLEQRILNRYVLTQFEAESELPASPAAATGSDADQATLHQAARLFHLWNTQASPRSMHAELRGISQSCAVPELAAFASALTDLEQTWRGAVPANSWLWLGPRSVQWETNRLNSHVACRGRYCLHKPSRHSLRVNARSARTSFAPQPHGRHTAQSMSGGFGTSSRRAKHSRAEICGVHTWSGRTCRAPLPNSSRFGFSSIFAG